MKLAVIAVLLVIIPFQAEAAAGCICKNVNLWVAYGKGLTGDVHKQPDPYVVVKIGDVTQKTGIIHGEANPSWRTKLPFHNVASNKVTITVFDADKGKHAEDDLLGTCMRKLFVRGCGAQMIRCIMDNEKGFVQLHYQCAKM